MFSNMFSDSVKVKLALDGVVECAQRHEFPTDIYLHDDCDRCDKYKYTLCCCFKSSLKFCSSKLKIKTTK